MYVCVLGNTLQLVCTGMSFHLPIVAVTAPPTPATPYTPDSLSPIFLSPNATPSSSPRVSFCLFFFCLFDISADSKEWREIRQSPPRNGAEQTIVPGQCVGSAAASLPHSLHRHQRMRQGFSIHPMMMTSCSKWKVHDIYIRFIRSLTPLYRKGNRRIGRSGRGQRKKAWYVSVPLPLGGTHRIPAAYFTSPSVNLSHLQEVPNTITEAFIGRVHFNLIREKTIGGGLFPSAFFVLILFQTHLSSIFIHSFNIL